MLLLALVAVLLPVVVTAALAAAALHDDRWRSPSAPLAHRADRLGRVSSRSARWPSPASAPCFAARLVDEGVPFWIAVATTHLSPRRCWPSGSAHRVAASPGALPGCGDVRVRPRRTAVPLLSALLLRRFTRRRPTCRFGPAKLVRFLDVLGQRTYYYVVLVVLGAVIALLGRLRRSGVGRAIMAVRDNADRRRVHRAPGAGEVAGLRTGRCIAGLGGALLAGAFENIAFTDSLFVVDASLSLVAMVVIGGMGSVSGAVIGAVWVIGIPASPRTTRCSASCPRQLGLLILLMYFPRRPQPGRLSTARRASCRGPAPDPVEASRADLRLARHQPVGRIGLHEGRPTDEQPRAGGVGRQRALRWPHGQRRGLDRRRATARSSGSSAPTAPARRTLMNAIGGFVPATGSVTAARRRGRRTARPATGPSSGSGGRSRPPRCSPSSPSARRVMVALEARGRARPARHRAVLPGPPPRRGHQAPRPPS